VTKNRVRWDFPVRRIAVISLGRSPRSQKQKNEQAGLQKIQYSHTFTEQ